MTQITASMVKELRKKTGLGMMDCKKALEQSSGNIDLAIENLRKSSILDAEKKASRTAVEGIIKAKIDPTTKKVVLIEINCETDFVSKDENFLNFSEEVMETSILHMDDKDLLKEVTSRLEESRKELVQKIGENVDAQLLDDRSLIAVQGPKSEKILSEFFDEISKMKFLDVRTFSYKGKEIWISRSGYTGEDGFEISILNNYADKLTRELINKGSKLAGLGARDTLRLEAGLCLYGHDLDKDKTPVEANLKWAISKERISKGDFIGSDIIIKQLNDGVTKIRVGIKPEGRIIAREKTKIFNQSDVHIGEITSGTFGPSVNGPVAMGYVENEFSKKNTKVFLEVRGKKYAANICSLPFYKKSYVKGVN